MSCLTGVGFFAYTTDIKSWISMQNNLPFKVELMAANEDQLLLLALLLFILLIMIKVGFIATLQGRYDVKVSF